MPYDYDAEEWERCPGCGERHPTRADIRDALLEDRFANSDDEESPKEFQVSPTNLHLIVNACQDIIRIDPALSVQVHSVASTLRDRIEALETQLNQGQDPPATIGVKLTLSQLAMATYALETVVLTNAGTEIAEEAGTLFDRIVEEACA